MGKYGVRSILLEDMSDGLTLLLSEDPNAAEVVKIEMGQLYLVRPGNIRSSRECMCELLSVHHLIVPDFIADTTKQ